MADAQNQIDTETLVFIYSHTKDAPERQFDDATSLDTKAIQVFAAASLVVGLTGFAFARQGDVPIGVPFVLIVAVVAYLGAGVTVLIQLVPRGLRGSHQADFLWPEMYDEPVGQVRHWLVNDISEAYVFNKTELDRKRWSLALALIFTLAEVALVGAALIASLFLV